MHKILVKMFTALAVFFIDGYLLKLIWNGLLTSLFHFDSITYTNALLLMIVTGILFHPRKVEDKDLE